MSPHETERLNFERQIVYARPISVLLALIAVAEQPVSLYPRYALNFLITYLIVSLLVIPAEWPALCATTSASTRSSVPAPESRNEAQNYRAFCVPKRVTILINLI